MSMGADGSGNHINRLVLRCNVKITTILISLSELSGKSDVLRKFPRVESYSNKMVYATWKKKNAKIV